MKKILALLVVVGLVVPSVLLVSAPAFALTYEDTVTVNATPAFIGIAVTEAAWTVNGGGTSLTAKNTWYYAHVTNTTVEPDDDSDADVDDGDCLLNLTNTSTVATDITILCADFVGGDAWTNGESKSANGANAYAMASFFSGDACTAGWTVGTDGVAVMKTGAAVHKNSLAATTAIKFGIGIKTPSDDPTSGTAQAATMTVTAVAD
jgi:hypothetical protein